MSETLITWPDVCVFCGDSNGKVGRTANDHWKQFRCGTEYEVIEGKTAWIQDDECKIAELRTALAAATKRAEEAEAKLAQSTNYVTDHDTYPTCVWFANGRVVSVNAAGVLQIRFGKQLEACDEREPV